MKRREEKQEDITSTLLFEMVAGVVGFGTVLFIVLLFNQGKRQSSPATPILVQEFASQMAAQAEMINDLEDDLSKSQKNVIVAKQETKEAVQQRKELVSNYGFDLASAHKQLDATQKWATQAEATVNRLRQSRKVRVYLVLDISASMGPAAIEAKKTFSLLARTMPLGMTSFECGIICYREGMLKHHPLQEIRRASDDGGRSVAAMNSFLNSLSVASAKTIIHEALDVAMGELDRTSSNGGSEIILLCADVSSGDNEGYDNFKGSKIINKVHRWSGRRPGQRRVLSIFTGEPTSDHRPFFERIAEANEDSRYSTDLQSMFPLVFEAAFIQEDNS